jgi:hypothetical protein
LSDEAPTVFAISDMTERFAETFVRKNVKTRQ